MIELDVTLWFQLANFIITLVVLNFLLIRPVRDMIRQRRETFNDIEKEIVAFTARAESELATYEAKLREAREEASEVRKSARADADALGQTILSDAAREAREALRSAQADLHADADRAEQSLRSGVESFVRATVDKLLK